MASAHSAVPCRIEVARPYIFGSVQFKANGGSMRVRAVVAAIAGVVIIGLALGGCSTQVSAERVATLTPTPTPTIQPQTVGAVVPAGTKLPTGQTLYATTGGQNIVVQADKPLPAPVVKDIVKTGQSNPIQNGKVLAPGYTAPSQAATAIESTGKEACVIIHAVPDPQGIDWKGFQYFTTTSPKFPTQAGAEAWCAKSATGPVSNLGIVVLNFQQ
jgi:hypothetical protein